MVLRKMFGRSGPQIVVFIKLVSQAICCPGDDLVIFSIRDAAVDNDITYFIGLTFNLIIQGRRLMLMFCLLPGA